MSETQDKPTVVIVDGALHPFHDFSEEIELWQSRGIQVELASCSTEEDLLALAPKVDALVYWGLHIPFTRRVIESLENCRLIARYGTGVDSVDLEAATENGILVAIPAGYCTREVADHASALLLSLARRIPFLSRTIEAGGWRQKSVLTEHVQRLSEQALGLVGFGRIAQQVAKNMKPMVGEILCADPYVDEEVAVDVGVKPVSLDHLLATSDLISVHVPLTPETHGLIGHDEFKGMKAGAFLVNTSRGPVIDEAALVGALETGQLAGAGLDVFTQAPLPADHPLRSLDNVVLTPHFASSSDQAVEDMFDKVSRIVTDVLDGRWPDGVVNPKLVSNQPLVR